MWVEISDIHRLLSFKSLDEVRDHVNATKRDVVKEEGCTIGKVCSRRVKIAPGVINIAELHGHQKTKKSGARHFYFIFAEGEMHVTHRSRPCSSKYEECTTFPLGWDEVAPGLDVYFDPHPSARLQFFVKTLTGKTLTFFANLNTDIYEFKGLISAKEGIPVHQLRLIFAGRQLEVGRTLGDHKIPAESTIHMVMRLRGGMYHRTSSRVGCKAICAPKITKMNAHVKFGPEDDDEFELELREGETRESLIERANEKMAMIKDLEKQIRAIKRAKRSNNSKGNGPNRDH